MSDQKTKTYKVKGIPPDAIVDLKISGLFYGRIVGAYFCLAQKLPKEDFLKYMKAIEQNKVMELPLEADQLNATALETLTIMIKALEDSFQAQGVLVDETVELPSGD